MSSKSVKSERTAGSRGSKSSKATLHTEELDARAAKFIDEKLPAFFGVKAAHHQASVIRGRNPKSLPKDSELWMYSRISNQRKNLIERGRMLWDVVGQVSLEKSHEENVKREEARRKSPGKKGADETPRDESADIQTPFSPPPPSTAQTSLSGQTTSSLANTGNHSKLGHMGEQIRSVLQNKQAALDIKINFKHRAPVAYGMTFLIRNYNDEVLYMHRLSADHEAPLYELRIKPMSQLEPHDRIKFKALDLVNPSNPKTIRFGDPVYLQCVVDEDNPNILAGFVMSTKVFEPPHLQSVSLDYHPRGHHHHGHHGHHHHSGSGTQHNSVTPTPRTMPLSNAPVVNAQTAPVTAQPAATVVDDGEEDDEDEDDDNGSASSFRDDTDAGASETSLSPKGSAAALTAQAAAQTATATRSATTVFHSSTEAATTAAQTAADICGFAQVTRITEHARLFEGQPPPDSAQALKNAMRYNSRQTMVLGKWIFTDGLRREQHEAKMQEEARLHQAQRRRGQGGGAGGAGSGDADVSLHGHGGDDRDGDMNAGISQVLMSLSPIVLQQDAYCLGSAQMHEMHKWPLTSFDILASHHQPATNNNNSSSSSSGSSAVADSRRSQQTESKKNDTSTNKNVSSSASVSSTASVMSTASSALDSSKGDSKDQQVADTWNVRYLKHLEHMKKGGLLPPRLESVVQEEKAKRHRAQTAALPAFLQPAQRGIDPDSARHGFAVLRRHQLRNAPYDFAVDRRCVWQLCVYEEFSDNFLELSSKEKHAKVVMETASMALKISKMNREGATVHIPANPAEQLPALVGGESFPRTLREITFRKNQRAEQEYLRARRIREYRLGQHFQQMIPTILEREGQGRMAALSSPLSSSMARPSTSSTIDSQSPDSRRGSSSYLNDDETAAEEEDEYNNNQSQNRHRTRSSSSILSNHDTLSASIATQQPTNNNSSVRVRAPDASTSVSSAHHHHHHSHHSSSAAPRPQLSEDIRRVFVTDLVLPTKEDLLLTDSERVKHFKELTGGEQILALHRTMHYYNKLTAAQLEQQIRQQKEEEAARIAKTSNSNAVHGGGAGGGTGGAGAASAFAATALASLSRSGSRQRQRQRSKSPSGSGRPGNNTTTGVLGGAMRGTASAPLLSSLELSSSLSMDDPDTSAAVTQALANKRRLSMHTNNNRKNLPVISSGVLKKLELLQQEEAHIVEALNYKGSLERNPLELEHRNWG